MLRFHVAHKSESRTFHHEAGPGELGREARVGAGVARFVLNDPYVSRDHVRFEELVGGSIRIANLSRSSPLTLTDGSTIAPESTRETDLPARFVVGETLVEIDACDEAEETESDRGAILTLAESAPGSLGRLSESGEVPDAARLARWFAGMIAVQKAVAGSTAFYDETARALVELIGLDRGMVLLLDGSTWKVQARHSSTVERGAGGESDYSRAILDEVERTGATCFQSSPVGPRSASLVGVFSVVAAPIFDEVEGRLLGVLYGSASVGTTAATSELFALEVQLVQVLAAAVAAGLARHRLEVEAARKQLQFERFFSADLARELDRNVSLLDGSDREVTVLSSDIRGFSRIAERLGPAETCRLVREVMDALTVRIVETGGLVVDYVGDGILAMWNAPSDQPDHADRACRSALAMLAEIPELSRRWLALIGGPLSVGIGVNTGVAMVGNTGSRLRLKYGPLGHTVNTVSRVEGATKHLGVPALITSATRIRLGAGFATRRLCQARVVGMTEAVEVHELHSGDVSAEWLTRRDAYETALAYLEADRPAEACKALYPLLTDDEGRYDLPTLTLMGRSVERLKTPDGPFEPVLVLGSK